jgi:putative ATPase
MVYAGEDPHYIFRRMIVLASEDVGLADPQAVTIVMSCAESFDRVGMPEGRYPLAQATLYLATAPKSNTVMGFFDALSTVEKEKEDEIPLHLRDANRDKHSFGHGKGYLYPHSYREHWVEQQYLPTSLQGQVFYQPSEQGYEDQIRQQVARRREAQLAALVEGIGVALPEVLTLSPVNSAADRWLQRTLSQTGERLGQVRDRLFSLANLQRHHLVVDLNAGSGLLTWEAIRQVPEGGVYACVHHKTDADALREQAQALPELMRPMVIQSPLITLSNQLHERVPDLKCDRLIGRNALIAESDKGAIIQSFKDILQPNGRVVLAESIPRHTQRLYQLIDAQSSLGSRLSKKLINAEEAIYQDADDPMVNWDADDLKHLFETAGFQTTIRVEHTQTETRITPTLLSRWFGTGNNRPSYGDRLSNSLTSAELDTVTEVFTKQLAHRVVQWNGAIGFVKAH